MPVVAISVILVEFANLPVWFCNPGFCIFFLTVSGSFLLINPINSKTLPPGTGGEADVPANVLILLDASGSMSNRIRIGVYYGNSVRAVAPVTNTDLVLVYANQRIKQVNQASNTEENIHASRAELNHDWSRFSLMDNEILDPNNVTKFLMTLPNLKALWLNGNPV